MATEALDLHIKSELVKFNLSDAAIAKMEAEYMPLRINGIEDKQGYNAVRTARLLVKGKRVEIEKTRKVLKEDSLAFGRAVDTEAKRITAKLETIETHLEKQESAIDEEKERLKAETERQRQEKINHRINVLLSRKMIYTGTGYGYADKHFIFNSQVEQFSDEEFANFCITVDEDVKEDEAKAAEEERLRKEEEERKAKAEEEARLKREAEEQAERERLAAERERLAEIDRKQKEDAAKLKAEQDRLDAEKREIERQKELEQAKKEAAERARIEAEQKAKREAEEKAEAARLAKLEEERQKALRPDKEKLVAFAFEIEDIPMPGGFTSKEARDVLVEVQMKLRSVAAYIRKEASNL